MTRCFPFLASVFISGTFRFLRRRFGTGCHRKPKISPEMIRTFSSTVDFLKHKRTFSPQVTDQMINGVNIIPSSSLILKRLSMTIISSKSSYYNFKEPRNFACEEISGHYDKITIATSRVVIVTSEQLSRKSNDAN